MMYGLASIIVMFLPFILLIKILLWLIVICSFAHSLRRSGRKCALSLILIAYDHNEQWRGLTRNGEVHRLLIQPSSVVTSRLICLEAKNQLNQRISEVIFARETDVIKYRQLARALKTLRINSSHSA